MAPSADAVVGMMDAAYFVGRKELLDWLNDLLDLNLQKIEQTAPGHIACQIFDLMYGPNAIPMTRVNWEAKSDYEFVQNYKLLQNGFNKHNVQRHVDVDKLIRAKYQDNLEFMQWFKAFYDQSGVFRDDIADPSAVRARGKGGKQYNQKHGNIGCGGGPRNNSNNNQRSKPRDTTNATRHAPPAQPTTNKSTTTAVGKPGTMSPRGSRPLRERPGIIANDDGDHHRDLESAQTENAFLTQKNADLTTKVEELELAILEIEKERDFYFEKLRNVEVMLQVHQEKPADESDPNHLVDKVFQVLYATAEDSIVVNDEGELVNASELSGEQLADAV